MAPGIEITIPTTFVATEPKSHTVYEILLCLPLQSLTVRKRYSDFVQLHNSIGAQAGTAAPASLPPKTFFSSTTHNSALTESRRAGLEAYLQTINNNADSRWRDTPAWRAFLNLPSNLSSKNSSASSLRGKDAGISNVSDPVLWLDVHRELKSLLQEARSHVATRDKAESIAEEHERGTRAKKALVKAGTLIVMLGQGLKTRQEDWGKERLGDGEVRRRRDLVAGAQKEKDDLENLLLAMAKKRELDQVIDGKATLIHENTPRSNGTSHGAKAVGRGRILGKETARTRELDNRGVQQLQQQMIKEQDEDLDIMAAAVRRQKELAIQINEELVVQNEMLDMLDDDVTRVEGKIGIAKKRVDRIN